MKSITRFLHRKGIRCYKCGYWGSQRTIRLNLKYIKDDSGKVIRAYYEKRFCNVCWNCNHLMFSTLAGTNL